jgi:hypothetical protein
MPGEMPQNGCAKGRNAPCRRSSRDAWPQSESSGFDSAQACAAAVLTFRPPGTDAQPKNGTVQDTRDGGMQRTDMNYGELVCLGATNLKRAPELKELPQHFAYEKDRNAKYQNDRDHRYQISGPDYF